MKASKVKCKSIKSYFDKDSKKKQHGGNVVKTLSETFGHTNFKSSLQRDAVMCVNEGQLIAPVNVCSQRHSMEHVHCILRNCEYSLHKVHM